jgi:putative CocE/NonD family hydrolase
MEITVEKNVRVAMRDGVELATDVYRPAGGGPHPVILQRTPYDKENSPSVDVFKAVQAGYAMVVQDTRGRFASGGTFDPFFREGEDGADTIAWAAAQPWSDGNVGMMGASYFGATQWLAAAEQPPALKAISPYITASDYYEGWTYQGGAFELGFILSWSLLMLGLGEVGRRLRTGEATLEDFGRSVAAVDANHDLYWTTPITEIEALKGVAPYYEDWIRHATYDDYWRSIAPRERYDAVAIPALNAGGWYDLFLSGTLENYAGRRAAGGEAAERSRLIIGPWAHGPSAGQFAQRSYGLLSGNVASDLIGTQLKWFDVHLKGAEDPFDPETPVRLFIMGADTWRDEADWPLPDTRYTNYYLHSGGSANSSAGDGLLSTEPPAGDEPHDAYLYDPRNPVPTVGGQTFLPGLILGANAGPMDQREVEARADVLVYSTPPLERDTEVTGPISLVLHVDSSARDTDFTGKLVDVHPDGRAEILTDGILRARYRNGTDHVELLEPGTVYELHLDLWATANVFRAGHRIRLDVSSSNFPRFDRNSNTGGTIWQESEAEFVQALNRVHHTGAKPSHLVLPIIDRS